MSDLDQINTKTMVKWISNIRLSLCFATVALAAFSASAQTRISVKPCESSPDIIPYIRGDKYGYVDREGKVIIPAKFDQAGTFKMDFYTAISKNASAYGTSDYALVTLDEIKYRIDKKGELVLKMDTVQSTPAVCCPEINHQLRFFETDQLWGIQDRRGKIVVPNLYDSLDYLFWLDGSEEYFIATKKGKYGIIDFTGKVVVEFDYDFLYNLNANTPSKESGVVLAGTLKGEPIILDLCGNRYRFKR